MRLDEENLGRGFYVLASGGAGWERQMKEPREEGVSGIFLEEECPEEDSEILSYRKKIDWQKA
jgi:hypothetical protein